MIFLAEPLTRAPYGAIAGEWVNDVGTDIKDSSVILMILLIHELLADIKDSSVILMILLVQFS